MRGSFKKKKAKISSVDLKKTRVSLEGIQRAKKDGTKINVYFHPSVLQIQSLNLEDKKRISVQTTQKESSKEIKKEKKQNASKKTASNN